MATKKTGAKTAPKSKATPKAASKSTAAKKTAQAAQGKTSKAKTAPAPKKEIPKFLKRFPTEYILGTEDYAALIEHHNELFDTTWLKWRVRPQVFFSIHERVWKHYHDEK